VQVVADEPYGPSSALRHVARGDIGGGYEWRSEAAPGRGVTVVELDGGGAVTRLAALWDGALVDDAVMTSLAVRATDV